jgi:transglutaminase-like putative cysteine protease
MRIAVRHITHYGFAEPVQHGLQRLRLKPKETHGQTVLDWDMRLDGAVTEADYDDQHGNHVTLISILPGMTSVTVTIAGTVQTCDNGGVLGPHRGAMQLWCYLDQTPLTRPGARLRALTGALDADRADRLGTLHALSAAVRGAVAYETGHTDAVTTAEEALAAGHGVCQDHAHIFIGAARLLGIPARYVSGYLLLDDRIDQDAGHAWAEAHVEGLGWVGFDISNLISPDPRYVRVATGCDYREAAPVTGIVQGGGQTDLSVRLAVAQQTAEQ